MTTLTRRDRFPQFEKWGRRLSNAWNSLFAPGDLPALVIGVLLLLMPALSLTSAGWVIDMNTLIPVMIFGVIFGFLLSRSQYNEMVGLIIGTIYGGCIILVVAAVNDPGDLGTGIFNVFTRTMQWISDALTGGINQDELVFTLIVSTLFWFLGYNLSWHIFRIDRVWRAVFPPALILITNNVYYSGTASLDWYLILFTFFTLLLLVRSNAEAREWDWYLSGIRVPRSLRNQIFRAGMLVAVIILGVAWLIPQQDLQDRLQRFQEFLASEPLNELSEIWNRLFSSADIQGPTTADYYGGDTLQLGGAIRLGDEIVFLVTAPPTRRYYWRSRIFDQYDSGRWASNASHQVTDRVAPYDFAQESYVAGSRVAVEQEFVIGMNASRLVYAAPQPYQLDLPAIAYINYVEDSANSISVNAVRPIRVLYEGDSYTVTSLMSAATPEQLRAAGTDYPEWVRNTYHGYIPSVTDRTVQLAQRIVSDAGAVTPYDRARAIESWLRSNIVYNELIPAPPPGTDPVDWVLFESRQGYCNYYASAMVVMLRTMGIPARLAAGFSQGTWDQNLGTYVVRERDAHTWVEVYFPGYGWIDFEPTAAQFPINRGDDPNDPTGGEDGAAPTNTALPPTSTPIPTNTPQPTQTSTPNGTPTDAAGIVPPLIPTETPTPSPTPTATPIIIPTQPPPERPQQRSALQFILPALGIVLVLLLFVALMIGAAFFTFWWWEWRGMRGMNPIVRAYARLERYTRLIGIHPAAEQTPQERRDRIVRELPAVEPPVTAITRLYVAERYGQPRTTAVASRRQNAADRAWLDTRKRIVRRWAKRTFVPFSSERRRKK